MSDVMIEAQGLTKRYPGTAKPVTAVDKAKFEIRRGEVVGFLGPNGAGKTTTMKMLTCFIAPTEGTARVNGSDVVEDPIGVRGSLGYLPESTPLYTEMIVLEYLEWVARMRNLSGDEAHRRIKKAVEQTDLGEVIAKEIRALSKGYRQRVGLAQALLHEPPILILDEPMSGLDPNQAVEIRDLIKEIGRERTVILSTHNLAEVQAACNRVLIISRGRIVADDTTEGLQESAGRRRFLTTVTDLGAKDVEGAFRKVAGVDRVRQLGEKNGETRFELIPTGSQDLRGAIFKAAVDGGFTLVELRTEGANLERVFRDLTTGGDPGLAGRSDAAETKKPEPEEEATDEAEETAEEDEASDEGSDDAAASDDAASGDEDSKADDEKKEGA